MLCAVHLKMATPVFVRCPYVQNPLGERALHAGFPQRGSHCSLLPVRMGVQRSRLEDEPAAPDTISLALTGQNAYPTATKRRMKAGPFSL